MEVNLPPSPPDAVTENITPPIAPSSSSSSTYKSPQPLQIIVTGDSEHDFFQLKQENLESILNKIPNPSETKVAVVSVVGAFRTGKSFLLNFFLRYLRSDCAIDDDSAYWMFKEGVDLSEGNMNDGWSLVESNDIAPPKSFAWRGGTERQTTGIWYDNIFI